MEATCCLLRRQYRRIQFASNYFRQANSTMLTKSKTDSFSTYYQNNTTLKVGLFQTNVSTQMLSRRDCNTLKQNLNTMKTTKRPDADYKLHETVLNAADATYHVSYIDEGGKDNPVVLCLHGMPGCHKEFLPILQQLVDGDTRVVLLNFPGVGYSWHLEGAPFDFTHLTKARLVKALLSHLGIAKVDMLVCVSASGHAGMELCANTDLIQNVTFAAVTHRPRGSTNALIRNIVYYSLKWRVSRCLIGSLILVIFRKMMSAKLPKIELLYKLAAEAKTWNWKQAQADLQRINDKGMPVLVLGAHDDPFVHLVITKGVMDLLGIPKENRLTYTKDYTWQPVNLEGKVNTLKRGIIFEKSSHLICKSHPDVVASAILDLIQTADHIKNLKETIP